MTLMSMASSQQLGHYYIVYIIYIIYIIVVEFNIGIEIGPCIDGTEEEGNKEH